MNCVAAAWEGEALDYPVFLGGMHKLGPIGLCLIAWALSPFIAIVVDRIYTRPR